jgi:signal transduction histidine kinase
VLRGLLDEARDGLLVLDEHGAILEANHAAARLLGHDATRLVGKPLAAVVSLDDRRRFRRELGRLGAGEQVVFDVRLLHGDAACTVSLRALPVTVPRRVAAVVSPERLLLPEPERPRSSERLQYFVLRFPYAVVAFRRPDLRIAFANGEARALLGDAAVRTGAVFGDGAPPELRQVATRLATFPVPLRSTDVELAEGRVFRVSGLAATSEEPAIMFIEDVSDRHLQERVMREFLRNAAHQLRTPVAGITAAVEMLQSGAKEQPVDRDRFLAHVERHAERLTRVARSLLTLARAQAGEDAPVDFVELRPLLDRLVDEQGESGEVTVLTDCPPGLAALATPDLLHEALAALLDNALTHTHSGEVRISAAQVNGRVLLTVSDQGPGILPEFVDRVFEPFFRLTPSGEGYGLGLAIAAQAVETMGGEIDVSSTVGAGTSFIVKLPSATVVR